MSQMNKSSSYVFCNLKVKVCNFIKMIWNNINIFDIPRLTREISCDVKHIRDQYEQTKIAVEQYKKDLEEERRRREKEQNLFLSVLDHLDDMVWAKDNEGKYIVANKAFREKFCYGMAWEELQGKTDIELAIRFKKLVGEENHTFGEKCADSDVIVREVRLPRKFLEFGNINGNEMKLMVNKSPVYDYKKEMFAICGSGRDVTEWHTDIENVVREIKNGCKCFSDINAQKILDRLNKFKFEAGDNVRKHKQWI